MKKNGQSPVQEMPNRRWRLAVSWFTGFLTRLLYRMEYVGLDNVPEGGPVILVANHTSLLDIPAIHTAIRPWISWVAKAELFKKPISRAFYSSMGCIPVDRHKTDPTAARGIFMALRARQIVGMFPQGTRVPAERISQARPHNGAIHFAIKTGAPILPVAVIGQFRLFHRVRIIYGKLWRPDLDPRRHYTAEELDELSLQMMKQIYALAGADYHLDHSAVKR